MSAISKWLNAREVFGVCDEVDVETVLEKSEEPNSETRTGSSYPSGQVNTVWVSDVWEDGGPFTLSAYEVDGVESFELEISFLASWYEMFFQF